MTLGKTAPFTFGLLIAGKKKGASLAEGSL